MDGTCCWWFTWYLPHHILATNVDWDEGGPPFLRLHFHACFPQTSPLASSVSSLPWHCLISWCLPAAGHCLTNLLWKALQWRSIFWQVLQCHQMSPHLFCIPVSHSPLPSAPSLVGLYLFPGWIDPTWLLWGSYLNDGYEDDTDSAGVWASPYPLYLGRAHVWLSRKKSNFHGNPSYKGQQTYV